MTALLCGLPSVSGSRWEPARRTSSVELWTAPAAEVEAQIQEQRARGDRERPVRIGVTLDTELTPANSGSWTRDAAGGWTWRLAVRSTGARYLVLGAYLVLVGYETSMFWRLTH